MCVDLNIGTLNHVKYDYGFSSWISGGCNSSFDGFDSGKAKRTNGVDSLFIEHNASDNGKHGLIVGEHNESANSNASFSGSIKGFVQIKRNCAWGVIKD